MKRTQKSAIKQSQSPLQSKAASKSPEKLKPKDNQGKVWNFQKKKALNDSLTKQCKETSSAKKDALMKQKQQKALLHKELSQISQKMTLLSSKKTQKDMIPFVKLMEERVQSLISKQSLIEPLNRLQGVQKLYDINLVSQDIIAKNKSKLDQSGSFDSSLDIPAVGSKSGQVGDKQELSQLRPWAFEKKKGDPKSDKQALSANGSNSNLNQDSSFDQLKPICNTDVAEFNGYSYKQLIKCNERRYLNIYQIACKPRILQEIPDQQLREDADHTYKRINELQKFGYEPQEIIEVVNQKLESLNKKDQTNESDFVNLELFDSIKEALLCSVCSDVFKDPLNVKQCLHKFCATCIEDYNRLYKKECPSCRQQIGSRRHLRVDYKTQSILKTLITDVSKFNYFENTRRKMNVDQKLACKSYLKNKKLILIKQKEQEKAYLKDEEEVKMLLRQQKNKWKKDTKMLRSGAATMKELIDGAAEDHEVQELGGKNSQEIDESKSKRVADQKPSLTQKPEDPLSKLAKRNYTQMRKTSAEQDKPKGTLPKVDVDPKKAQQLDEVSSNLRNKRSLKQVQKVSQTTPQQGKESVLLKNSQDQGEYYVEFNIRQQRNFENCIIGNEVVVTPERLVCLSNIRIKDMRKFVYYQVLDKFQQLDPSNIELAYRSKVPSNSSNQNQGGQAIVANQQDGMNQSQPIEKTYISLADQYNLTINDLIKKNYWKKSRCDMQYKEDNHIPIGHPKFNETLYVRFIKA